MTEYENLNKWVLPSNYVGAEWYGYYSAGVALTRDSDALERANFQAMQQALGKHMERCTVVREGHWAIGWLEWIAIPDDCHEPLDIANDLMDALGDHPVISDDLFSEYEQEDANQTWANCYDALDRVEYIKEHRNQFEFYDFRELLAVVRGEYLNGYASELLY